MDIPTFLLGLGIAATALGAGACALRPAMGARMVPAALIATAAAASAGLVAIATGHAPGTWHGWSLASASDPHAVSLGLRPDATGLVMVLLIAGIGLAVARYARTALVGDPRAAGFHAALALVVAAALVQALSPGLVQFALAWIAVGWGLQRLFRHDPRPAAMAAARAKLVAGKVSDLAMAAAIALLLVGAGTTDFAGLATAVRADAWALAAALAVVLAVAVRIALMPFQSWLLGTVEAPTPLSALMHAGVVNAGGLLVILAAPLSAAAPAALDALLVLGLVSAVGGPLAMWAQTDLKRSLAWSTVGQMGFMAVQCGLGAYAAALLHLVGHGCYKANAFLRSGTLERAVEARPPVAGATVALAGWAVGTLVALAALAATYRLLGADPATLPGGWTLVAVQALAVGQVLASPAATALGALPRAGLVVPAAALYAALTWTIEHLLHGHVAAAPALADRGAHGPVLAVLVPAALAALTIIWVLLPRLAAQPWALAFRVHAGNGFYLPLLAERLLRGRA